jgi:hypothetical protein
MSAALQAILDNPRCHDYLAILKGARNGLVYGFKVRFPHALIMAILFGRGEYVWFQLSHPTRRDRDRHVTPPLLHPCQCENKTLLTTDLFHHFRFHPSPAVTVSLTNKHFSRSSSCQKKNLKQQ